MFINKIPFLALILENIEFTMIQNLGTHILDNLYKGIKNIKTVYEWRGFLVVSMNVDNEFLNYFPPHTSQLDIQK